MKHNHPSFEHSRSPHNDHLLSGITHELHSGSSYTIRPAEPAPNTTPVVAEFSAGQGSNSQVADTKFEVIDLRRAPELPNGSKLFEGRSLSPAALYALTQPSNQASDTSRGVKTLQPGETFLLGRDNDESLFHFDLSSRVSRKHLVLRVALDGSAIQFADLHSTNGTVLIDRSNPETSPIANRRQSAAPNLAAALRPLGETGEFTDEEEALIQSNLNLMLGDDTYGMQHLLIGESVGGNARSCTIDGTTYDQSAANGYADQQGRIHIFTNTPSNKLPDFVRDALPPSDELVRVTFLAALQKLNVINGQIVKRRPESWPRHDHIMEAFATVPLHHLPLTEAVDRGVITPPAARILGESVNRYNATPS